MAITAPADPDDLDAVEQANGRGAAFVEQWDEWREGGAAVVPCFGPFFDDGVFAVQSAMVGGVAEWGGKHGTVMGKDAKRVTVLLAGLEKEEVSAIRRPSAGSNAEGTDTRAAGTRAQESQT